MLGFKSFHAAKNVLAGIELMHMINNGQLNMEGVEELSYALQMVEFGQERSKSSSPVWLAFNI